MPAFLQSLDYRYFRNEVALFGKFGVIAKLILARAGRKARNKPNPRHSSFPFCWSVSHTVAASSGTRLTVSTRVAVWSAAEWSEGHRQAE